MIFASSMAFASRPRYTSVSALWSTGSRRVAEPSRSLDETYIRSIAASSMSRSSWRAFPRTREILISRSNANGERTDSSSASTTSRVTASGTPAAPR